MVAWWFLWGKTKYGRKSDLVSRRIEGLNGLQKHLAYRVPERVCLFVLVRKEALEQQTRLS